MIDKNKYSNYLNQTKKQLNELVVGFIYICLLIYFNCIRIL